MDNNCNTAPETAVAISENTRLPDVELATSVPTLNLAPRNIAGVQTIAKLLVDTGLTPYSKDPVGKQIRDTAGKIIAGMRIGIDPVQACASFAAINGRMCLWGDAMMAVVQASGKLASFKVEWAPKESAPTACRVEVTRTDVEGVFSGTFSVEQARTAGLLGKGPWSQYTPDMLFVRARSRALRRGFADVLGGIYSADEAVDGEISSGRWGRRAPAPAPEADAPAPAVATRGAPTPAPAQVVEAVAETVAPAPAETNLADAIAAEMSGEEVR